jgi:hypothetical protein
MGSGNSRIPPILRYSIWRLIPETGEVGPISSSGEGLKSSPKSIKIDQSMDLETADSKLERSRPACFGDEGRFVAYMETPTADAECGKCPSEDECGEFILLKCSRELLF